MTSSRSACRRQYLALQPGALIDLDLSPRSWRVEQVTIEAFVVILELRPSWTSGAALAADPGRIVPNVDVPAAGLSVALFDVADVLGLDSTTPTLLLAASSASAYWTSYKAEIVAGQQSFEVPVARRKSVLGRASTVLMGGDAYLINQAGSFDVELIDQDQWLTSCDDEALVGGGNLAILGSEILQFGGAEPLGQGRFRLTRLLRGRAGTEWAMDSHVIGEAFALIEADSLRAVSLPSWTVGATASASIQSVAGSSSSAPILVSGESLRPISPVDLAAAFDAAGNLALTWTRRSRKGFAWTDEIDAPLGETSEQYRITVDGTQGSVEFEAATPQLVIPAAQIGGIGTGPITIEVRQVGDAAASRPAAASLTV